MRCSLLKFVSLKMNVLLLTALVDATGNYLIIVLPGGKRSVARQLCGEVWAANPLAARSKRRYGCSGETIAEGTEHLIQYHKQVQHLMMIKERSVIRELVEMSVHKEHSVRFAASLVRLQHIFRQPLASTTTLKTIFQEDCGRTT